MAKSELVELADGVFARLHEGLTNSGIIVGDDSVLVIDSLRVPSFARELREIVRQVTDKPIRYVVDTHGHWDHAWGNEVFAGESTIIGHVNCRREMEEFGEASRRDVLGRNSEWQEELRTVTITPPDLTFDERLELHFGGRDIDLVHLGRAHTSGDIFIHLPDDGLVFTGDVIQDGRVPFMLDGFPAEWVETDARLLELPFERFVSGHGPVGSREAVEEALEMMDALVSTTERAMLDGHDLASTQRIASEELTPRFGGWGAFERVADGAGRLYHQLAADWPTSMTEGRA